MANDNYYLDRDYKVAWFPESSFRTNSEGKDTANAAAQTAFCLPGRLLTTPVFYIRKNRHYSRIVNSKFWGYIGDHGYTDGQITLDTDMLDFSWMYYLCKACTTTDNTPGAGYYTHVYATTTAQTSPPPSFQLILQYGNYEAGNIITVLLTGCVITGCVINASENSAPIKAAWSISFANAIAGTSLTSWPTFGTLHAMLLAKTSVTLAKGGTDYPGKAIGFTIQYLDKTYLPKGANEEHPNEAVNGNPDIHLKIDYAIKDETLIQDIITSPLAAATASDVDCTIKMYQDATNYYVQFAFEKLWGHAGECAYDFARVDGQTALAIHPEYIIKPAEFETGAVLTITEVNNKDDDRYET